VANLGERFIVDLESGKPACQIGALAVAKGVANWSCPITERALHA